MEFVGKLLYINSAVPFISRTRVLAVLDNLHRVTLIRDYSVDSRLNGNC